MQLTPQTEAALTNMEDDETKSFTVEVNAVMFRDFFDTRYSDKPGAIIRELVCNAWDSHIVAGTTDKLVDIHLPDPFVPELIIRDYGTGLSHDDMMNLYRTFFQSKSRFSELTTGGLGIGSKSPFCYCDNFMTESFFNGEHRKYQVYLDADMPKITLISCESTNEVNGLKVTITIQEKDFDVFEEAANKQLFLFKGKTTHVVDNLQFKQFSKENLLVDSDEFMISKEMTGYSYSRDYSTQLYAAMGNVLYKIDASLVQNNNSKGIQAILFFNLGEIDFASNREALSYNEKTLTAIKNRLDKAIHLAIEGLENEKIEILALPILEKIKRLYKLQEEYGNYNRNHSQRHTLMELYLNQNNDVRYWNEELNKIYSKISGLQARLYEESIRWSRSNRPWIAKETNFQKILKELPKQDFLAVIGTEIVMGPRYKSVMKASGLEADDRIIVYGSLANWKSFMDFFPISITFTKLEIKAPKIKNDRYESRKWYITYSKGVRDEHKLFQKDYTQIYQNNEDGEPKEWMKVLSTLFDDPKLPYIFYNGRIRSVLENSFTVAVFGGYKGDKEVLKQLQDNLVRMRLMETLYCVRFLDKEIRTIKDYLPDSQFVKEIQALPMFDLIEDPDDVYRRLKDVNIIPNDVYRNYKNHIPNFLNNYPMLRHIRSGSRYTGHSSDEKNVSMLDQNALTDYIRLCEGEKNEVSHYNIINRAARRKRKSIKLIQDGIRREESITSDNGQQVVVVGCDLQGSQSDLHSEGIQQEEHNDQEREVLLQETGDSQLSDQIHHRAIQEEETNRSIHKILRKRNEKPIRSISKRTIRLPEINKVTAYKSRNISRLSINREQLERPA